MTFWFHNGGHLSPEKATSGSKLGHSEEPSPLTFLIFSSSHLTRLWLVVTPRILHPLLLLMAASPHKTAHILKPQETLETSCVTIKQEIISIYDHSYVGEVNLFTNNEKHF